MLYRLFTLVAVLCLLAAGLLAIASHAMQPGNGWSIGGRPGDRGSMLLSNGVVSIGRGGGHYLISIAFSEIAILLAVPALAWGVVTLFRLRRRRNAPPGFGVEPVEPK
ncbi:MAG TPA: hypothetical protein VGI81_16230 [Tepidisphaeraceae bacterium]|jgi:hypothetical protein